MLDPVGALRHLAVGGSLLAGPALVLAGVLGGGLHPERFDAKQVLVTPAGGDGVRVREVIDQDFGTNDRHGHERIIPNDFGVPTNIEASSPDAPAQLDAVDYGYETRIRLGDPDVTIDGQHRYVLSYTLPSAQLTTGMLALDIIANKETFETERFEVVVSGFELTDPTCNVGAFGDVGGCNLVREGDVYRALIEPLEPGQGITIGGTIVSITAPADVPVPQMIERRSDASRVPLALGVGALGGVAGLGGFVVARRLGRNEVGGGGAAGAAYGADGGPTRMVSDRELESMVTTEFVPPQGLRPWQGAVLLNEQVDTDSVGAWFADQIALEVLVLRGDPEVLAPGPRLSQAPADVQELVHALFGADEQLELGSYQPRLESLWAAIRLDQLRLARESKWWKKFGPGEVPRFPTALSATVVVAGAVVGVSAWQGWLRAWPVALAVGFLVPALVAGANYRKLLPVRSANGSGLALRTESFRRFLEASEGQHVEWAWKNGLLREYTAWAVALGAADAWGRAVAHAAVPPADLSAQTSPMLMYTHWALWNATRSAPPPPSSSGGGSGGGGWSGGFSGGSVGGGGGGGSSGSW